MEDVIARVPAEASMSFRSGFAISYRRCNALSCCELSSSESLSSLDDGRIEEEDSDDGIVFFTSPF